MGITLEELKSLRKGRIIRIQDSFYRIRIFRDKGLELSVPFSRLGGKVGGRFFCAFAGFPFALTEIVPVKWRTSKFAAPAA